MEVSQFNDAGRSALLSFAVENTRSFRDEARLSFIASDALPDGIERPIPYGPDGDGADSDGNVPGLLPVAGVFGANASGKSALAMALRDMELMVRTSFANIDLFRDEPRPYFKLEPSSADRPTRLEVEVAVRGSLWHYGFTYFDDRIETEYASRTLPAEDELHIVFSRDGDAVEFGDYSDPLIEQLAKFMRPTSLLLSVAGSAGESTLASLYNWFHDQVYWFRGGAEDTAVKQAAKLGDTHLKHKERLLHLLRFADLGLSDITWTAPSAENIESLRGQLEDRLLDEDDHSMPSLDDRVLTLLDLQLGSARFEHVTKTNKIYLPQEAESQGTLAWTALVGRILLALRDGDFVIFDEIDCSLHPHLVERAVDFFQDTKHNPHYAQLLFNAHTPSLMGGSARQTLRPDQVWFTEKDSEGASTLYSLADMEPSQTGHPSLTENYLRGRYGGVPYLNPADLDRASLPG